MSVLVALKQSSVASGEARRVPGRPTRSPTPGVDQLGRTAVDQVGRTGLDQLGRTRLAQLTPPGWTSLAGLRVDLITRSVTRGGVEALLTERRCVAGYKRGHERPEARSVRQGCAA